MDPNPKNGVKSRKWIKILKMDQNPILPQKSFVVFMFCQTFDARHQNIIISQKILQNKLGKRIAET